MKAIDLSEPNYLRLFREIFDQAAFIADVGIKLHDLGINLLRPAMGQALRCRATVLKPGRTLTVAESEVWAAAGDGEKLVAKATVTLAVVNKFQD